MQEFTPDFTKYHASTPIYKKGMYEIVVDKVQARAYDTTDDAGQSKQVRMVTLRNKMVGVYDSKGKLLTTQDGAEIKGEDVEDVRLYIHSDGAMKFTKRILMAVLGYSKEEEDKFNEFLAKQDVRFSIEEKETEDGYNVVLGSFWEGLAGKHFKVGLSEGVYERNGVKEPQQNFDTYLPVG